MSTIPISPGDGSQVSVTAAPAPETRNIRQTVASEGFYPTREALRCPLADQFAWVEAHAQEIVMTGPPQCGLGEAAQSVSSPAAPPPLRRKRVARPEHRVVSRLVHGTPMGSPHSVITWHRR